jgi:hypothetical protein
MTTQWEQDEIKYDDELDIGYYTLETNEKGEKSLVTFDIDYKFLSIKNKEDARAYIDSFINDTNILYYATKYYSVKDETRKILNKHNYRLGLEPIGKLKKINRVSGGANEEIPCHTVNQNKYINGMMQLLDTWHDFGIECVREIQAETGFMLPTIFGPKETIMDNKGKYDAIPSKDKGFSKFILDKLSLHKDLIFKDPYNGDQKIENPFYKIMFKNYDFETEVKTHNLLDYDKLYKHYISVRGGLAGSNPRFTTRDIWLTRPKNKSENFSIELDMIIELCNDLVSCYAGNLTVDNKLHFQIDNWSIVGEYLIKLGMVNEELQNKFKNSHEVMISIGEHIRQDIHMILECSDATLFDNLPVSQDLKFNPKETGNIYPDNLPYQVTLKGCSRWPTVPNEETLNNLKTYIIRRKIDEEVKLSNFPDRLFSSFDTMLVEFEVKEDSIPIPFTSGLVSIDTSRLFSKNNIVDGKKTINLLKKKNVYEEFRQETLYETERYTKEQYYDLCTITKGFEFQENIVMALKPSTRYALKRAGDWGQVESCIGHNKIFVTSDLMAATYAISRGVQMLYNNITGGHFTNRTINTREILTTILPVSFILSKPLPPQL